MLSYRKSQQASLTEKLKKKNVIHVLGVSGSGTTMARLCLSAFVRVATPLSRAFFKSALPLPQRIRAGCDPLLSVLHCLRVSLPQRIRAGCDCDNFRHHPCRLPLPQRIRAGCDSCAFVFAIRSFGFATAHSCGLRLELEHGGCITPNFATAHSCGLRRSTIRRRR